MVTLSSWKKEQGLSVPALAKRFGASEGAVIKWLRGERVPRRAMCRKIVALTDRAVTMEDLYAASFEEPRSRPAPAAPPADGPEPERDGPLDRSGELA